MHGWDSSTPCPNVTDPSFLAAWLAATCLPQHVLRHNRLQDAMYRQLPLYAQLQQRAEDPAFVARFQLALLANYPAFQRLRASVRDPSFQASLQRGIYRPTAARM